MTQTSWWESAAVYQLYVRSFADGNADGDGDFCGVRSRHAKPHPSARCPA